MGEQGVGFRAWSVSRKFLMPIGGRTSKPWLKGINTAVCDMTQSENGGPSRHEPSRSMFQSAGMTALADLVQKRDDLEARMRDPLVRAVDPLWRSMAEQSDDIALMVASAKQRAFDIHNERTPVEDCTCGLWSLPTAADVMIMFDDHWAYEPEWRVIGSVRIWGKTIIHEFGTRAKYAQITGLLREPHNGLQIARLTTAYDVPAFDTTEELEEFARSC